jgi:hypothetical protein
MVNLTKRKFSNGRKSRKNFSNCGSWKKVNNKNPMPSKMYGGSPQSELVMNDTMKQPVLNDYITSPRIRQEGYSDAFPAAMCGGSPASDMVMENLNDMANTESYPPEPKVAGNMNSLKLYQTTGGARRRSHRSKSRNNNKHKKHSKKNNKNRKTNNNKKHNKKSRSNKRHNHNNRNNRNRVMRGGASDWMISQNSLGNINAPEQPASWVGQFSQSTATSRDMLMNPPTMGLAGSGYPMGSLEGSNVRMTGAPL